jgi:NAD(P)-dependent dehydrogenase (short-subunit alcohol dehydrogenase family)
MRPATSPDSAGTILLIGASRGLGHAMAAELLKRGWHVVGTVRDRGRTALHDLADEHPGRVEIESLDITEADHIVALGARRAGHLFDILFVNAGTANHHQGETIAQVSTDEFVRVMVTNALSPMRAVETLQALVAEQGVIGIMSSGQGSVGNNEKGGHEVYRGTKAALNTYMRSYAARHAGEARALLLMAPGWIRTELGGPDAPLTMEEAIPDIVDVLLAQQGASGLRYLDRKGHIVPW